MTDDEIDIETQRYLEARRQVTAAWKLIDAAAAAGDDEALECNCARLIAARKRLIHQEMVSAEILARSTAMVEVELAALTQAMEKYR